VKCESSDKRVLGQMKVGRGGGGGGRVPVAFGPGKKACCACKTNITGWNPQLGANATHLVYFAAGLQLRARPHIHFLRSARLMH
jgi:hypothetical protein